MLQTTLFKILFYITLIAITGLAFLQNYDALPPIVSFDDLLNHTVAFTVLFLLFRHAHPTLLTKHIVITLLSYAILIEAVQYFLPTRCASWSDIAADGTGLVIGYLILFLFKRFPYTKNPFS